MGSINISEIITSTLFIKVVEVLFIFGATMGTVAYLSLVERRVSAFMQKRVGP